MASSVDNIMVLIVDFFNNKNLLFALFLLFTLYL